MSAAINVVCYKWKTLANGESPLMVRVAKGGKRTMQSLGISINPKYWDFTRNKPKPNCPNKETARTSTANVRVECGTKGIYHHYPTQ